MRLGSFRLSRNRAIRGVVGIVVTFLLAGNVLAAAGLCAVKAPAGSHEPSHLPASAAPSDASDCAGHHAGHSAPASDAHHCPSDDPSAQTRTVDVPAAQVIVAIASAPFSWSDATLRSAPLVVTDHRTEPRPLYARLQRLRL